MMNIFHLLNDDTGLDDYDDDPCSVPDFNLVSTGPASIQSFVHRFKLFGQDAWVDETACDNFADCLRAFYHVKGARESREYQCT